MVNQLHKLTMAAVALAVCGIAIADEDDEQPDEEFLEYLGMWEDEDDSWLLVSADTELKSDDANDPLPRDEDATEKDDES